VTPANGGLARTEGCRHRRRPASGCEPASRWCTHVAETEAGSSAHEIPLVGAAPLAYGGVRRRLWAAPWRGGQEHGRSRELDSSGSRTHPRDGLSPRASRRSSGASVLSRGVPEQGTVPSGDLRWSGRSGAGARPHPWRPRTPRRGRCAVQGPSARRSAPHPPTGPRRYGALLDRCRAGLAQRARPGSVLRWREPGEVCPSGRTPRRLRLVCRRRCRRGGGGRRAQSLRSEADRAQ
jgi:hypothetical protein